MGSPVIKYTRALSDWNVHTAPLPDFLALQLASWGRPEFNACEYLEHSLFVRPFFDYDQELASPPTTEVLDQAADRCSRAISEMFGGEPTFDLDLHVVRAHRHGFVPSKNLHKVSFRFWIKGFSLLMQHIPLLIRACCSPETRDVFDLSIYSKRRLLAVPGGCKGNGDHRVLELGDRGDARWCLCQWLEGDEQPLDLSSEITASMSESKGSLALMGDLEDWAAFEESLTQAGFREPRPIQRREAGYNFTADNLGTDCPCCPWVHDSNAWWVSRQQGGQLIVKNYSDRCMPMHVGHDEPMFVEEVPDRSVAAVLPHLQKILVKVFGDVPQDCHGHDPSMRECRHVIQHLQSCPTCAKHHQEDLWYIYEPIRSIFSVRNAAFDCEERLIPPFSNPFLQNLVTNCTSDRDYADLFISEHEDVFTSDGSDILRFESRWTSVQDQDMQSAVQDWLTKVMRQLFLLMRYEETFRKLQKEKMPQDFKAYIDMYRATEKYLGKEANMRSLLTTIKRKLRQNGLWEGMDMDPYVLGCDNGVLLLREGVFRPAVQRDLVSKSVGYDWVEAVDPVIMDEVRACMAQIYPEPDERDVAQMFGGYSMLGVHSEKKFGLFTDAGGARAGNNAKSTFAKALHAVLGPQYSVKGKNELLYRSDYNSENVNSHSSGLLAYKGIRAAYFEELDQKRKLLDGFIKDINGSRAHLQARAAGSSTVEQFEWITKQLLITNQGSMPEFDFTDAAMVDRMLVIQHRSRFCSSLEEYEREKHIPNTYLSDSDMGEKIKRWRPYLLRWFLEGLQKYFERGFKDLPVQCTRWRQALVSAQDTVATFVTETVVKTGVVTDYVDKVGLYERYKTQHPEEKIKKTALGKRKFEDQLMVHLGLEEYHEGPKRIPGTNALKRRIWLGYQLQQEN